MRKGDQKSIIAHISDLKPDPSNARRHNPRNIGMIGDSLQEVGAARSIVIDEDNVILAGNGVVEAAAERGIEKIQVIDADGETIIAVRRTGLTPEQKTRLALFDNRTQETSDWNPEVLASLLQDDEAILKGLFEKDELAELLKGLEDENKEDPGAAIDKAEELQEKWRVKRGDLWQIGQHRLLCGDSTCAEDVGRLGVELNAILFTDPPYGINRDPSWLDDVGTHRQALSSRDVLQGDDGSLDISFLFGFPKRMIWGFPYIYDIEATGWIVWDKQPGVETRGIVTPIEMASTTMRKGFDMVRVMWGGYYRAAGEKRMPHPTQKPVTVITPFMADWTKPNDVVFDPFLGSGTTMVAAEQTGRVCYGMEIAEKYCAVILERMTGLGLDARLLSNG